MDNNRNSSLQNKKRIIEDYINSNEYKPKCLKCKEEITTANTQLKTTCKCKIEKEEDMAETEQYTGR